MVNDYFSKKLVYFEWKWSVFGVFLVRIFRIRTEYGLEKLGIQTLFTQWDVWQVPKYASGTQKFGTYRATFFSKTVFESNEISNRFNYVSNKLHAKNIKFKISENREICLVFIYVLLFLCSIFYHVLFFLCSIFLNMFYFFLKRGLNFRLIVKELCFILLNSLLFSAKTQSYWTVFISAGALWNFKLIELKIWFFHKSGTTNRMIDTIQFYYSLISETD